MDGFPYGRLEDIRPRGLRGYADLVLAHAAGGVVRLAAVADQLGYHHVSKRSDPVQWSVSIPPPTHGEEKPEAPLEFLPLEVVDIPFWQLKRRERVERAETPTLKPRQEWKSLPTEVPVPPDLVPWSELYPRVRSGFARWVDGKVPDIKKMVRQIENGRMLHRVPRQARRRWGRNLQIIIDHSGRLTPFYEDQDRMAVRFASLFPRGAVQYVLCRNDVDTLLVPVPDGGFEDYRPPEPGTLVVVLGDLGCLAGEPRSIVGQWAALGRQLAEAGCWPVVLNPAPRSRWHGGHLRWWTMLEWDRRAVSPSDREELDKRAWQLLRLLSLAIRIEPGLLREYRLLLGAAADAGTEVDVWQHASLIGRSGAAATLDQRVAKKLRGEIITLDDEEAEKMRKKALRTLRRYRAGVAPEVWLEEAFGLPPRVLPEEIRDNDLPWLCRYLIDHAPRLAQQASGRAWYRRLYGRVLKDHYHNHDDPAFKRAQLWMYDAAFRDHLGQSSSPPPGFDPAAIPGDPEEEHAVELRQIGEALTISSPGAGGGVPLATLRTANGWVAIGGDTVWKSGAPPTWAKDWGWDEFGAWETFSVSGVTQRMRWIPPGQFLMGSMDAFDDERPQHSVTISRGFWMFDTPCTQALWQAVMGENPSRFKFPNRPVERVNWHDVQTFLSRLNELLLGLDLCLPTEAQWEYACCFGARAELGQIAWYEDNSSGGTHPVGLKRPNDRGLYDMLGNVCEWCEDGKRKYVTKPESDPRGFLENGANRAIRGASWRDNNSHVRAASRRWARPNARFVNLGFRCIRVPLGPGGEGGAEPSAPANGQAERRTSQGLTGGAGEGGGALLRLDQGEEAAQCPLPLVPSFQIRTDCERLTFSRVSRPDWAEAMGRDRFGLWADIVVNDVRQRLRWFPPRQFLMGSPESEVRPIGDEGPQHLETIYEGYWLFDTPCTRALWKAVMDHYVGVMGYYVGVTSPLPSDKPVERVNWIDVQRFLENINRFGFVFGVPTRAQWENACRADNDAMLYMDARIQEWYEDDPTLDEKVALFTELGFRCVLLDA